MMRLNFDGSKMEKDVHYGHLYAPVVSWTSISLALVIATANSCVSTMVDDMMAFLQMPS